MTSLEECCDGVVGNLRADGLLVSRFAARLLAEALEHQAEPEPGQHAKAQRGTRQSRDEHQNQTDEDCHAQMMGDGGKAVK
jgi:hypothetical protein